MQCHHQRPGEVQHETAGHQHHRAGVSAHLREGTLHQPGEPCRQHRQEHQACEEANATHAPAGAQCKHQDGDQHPHEGQRVGDTAVTRKLVLLRHGQSQWNLDNRFTGWVDVELTEQGRREAAAAGRLMREEGLQFDVAHTSVLKRAIHTLQGALAELDQDWLPVSKSWRLNERHYGGLQGLDKAETAAKHGEDQVKIWRRSYDIPPPAMDIADPGHPIHDRRYAGLDRNALPGTESLATTLDRVLPYWFDAIAPQLKDGKTVLVTAHGNSLRALYKYLNHVSQEAILELNIPTGIPLLFELNDDLSVQSFRYLGDPEAARKAAEAVANQGKAK